MNLTREGTVYVLDLGSGQNTINPDFLAEFGEALDEVEAAPPPRALVTTASGQFFSTGLDVEWIADHPDRAGELVAGMHALIARILEYPAPTVAAIQRHVFAGGALLALAHDYRVMRADRGYLGLPEVDVRIAFTRGVSDLVRSRVAPQVAHEALTSGRRYTGEDAHAASLVDALADEGEVVAKAIEIAAPLGEKDPSTYAAIKATLYRETLASLRDPEVGEAGADRFGFAVELWRQSQA